MTESECREVVERVAGPLAEALGIAHWTLEISYAYRREESAACCDPDPTYEHAHVQFNCDSHDTPADVFRSLYHEFCHILVSPFREILAAYTPHVKGQTPEALTYGELFDYFEEMLVLNAERMFRGLGGADRFLPLAEGKVVAAKAAPPRPKARRRGRAE